MRRRCFLYLCLCAAVGCTSTFRAPPGYVEVDPREAPPQANPLFVPAVDKDFLFDQAVDVVDDYFRVERQERLHQLGDLVTEGRIETLYESGATVLEPWRKDSATPYERWESTLQSTRRKASVHLIPVPGGYMIQVAVIKELENVKHPNRYFAADRVINYDQYPDRYVDPTQSKLQSTTWFPLRRDVALEQQILHDIQARLAPFVGPRPALPPVEVIPAPSPGVAPGVLPPPR